MENEFCRLASFDLISTSIPSLTLVNKGFYYDRRTERIQCTGCDYSLSQTSIVEPRLHSVDCRWRNSDVQFESQNIENQPASIYTVNSTDSETGAGIASLLPNETSNRTFEGNSGILHRKCSLRYFISNDRPTEMTNGLILERIFENTRVVNYERGPTRNEHDRLCLKSREANTRWKSFLSIWQHHRIQAEMLEEMQHLCFMLSRVGFFLIRALNPSIKLELACSFCKRIVLLNISFESSAEEILADLLHKHRIAASTCPTSLNLQGKLVFIL